MTPPNPETPLLEVCIEGVDALVTAQDNGADRVELCASLLEGGLTPSFGVVKEALRVARIPVHVIVRPRGGDFLYTELEYASMLEDVTALRELGAQGVVIGCLTPDGKVDEARTRALVQRAEGMSVTFHRAFDMTENATAALDALVRCGVHRVLTSGLHDTVEEGLENLCSLNLEAAGRITVMGCGGLDPYNITRVRDYAGLRELHFAALREEPSAMAFRNPEIGMGGTDKQREYNNSVTDGALVRATIDAARGTTVRP